MRRTLIITALFVCAALCLGRYQLTRVVPANNSLNSATSHNTARAAKDQNIRHKLPAGLRLAAHTGNAYQYVLELFASLPSGTSLDQNQFDKALGSDAATFLRSINVTHIDSVNNTVHVTLSTVYTTTTSAADIRLDQAVAFSFSENAAGTLICDNITGIEVNANALLGWMPITHAEISHDTAGDTIIQVDVSTLFGTVKRTIKLDPNGKTIS